MNVEILISSASHRYSEQNLRNVKFLSRVYEVAFNRRCLRRRGRAIVRNVADGGRNRLFPSCLFPLSQNESSCETILLKIHLHFHFHANQTPLHTKRFARGLGLKQRKATRKWPIGREMPQLGP